MNSADVIKDTPLAQAHNIIKIMRGPAHWDISISILKMKSQELVSFNQSRPSETKIKAHFLCVQII